MSGLERTGSNEGITPHIRRKSSDEFRRLAPRKSRSRELRDEARRERIENERNPSPGPSKGKIEPVERHSIGKDLMDLRRAY